MAGASFVALSAALLFEAAREPPRLAEPPPEPPPPAPADAPPPEGPLVVMACGAVDPVYALRRRRPTADPPALFAPLAALLEPAQFRLLGLAPVDAKRPGVPALAEPLVSDEGAQLVALGHFDLAVFGPPDPARGGRPGALDGAERLRAAGVSALGAAETADEALGPLRYLVEGHRVAWLAFDEPEGAPAERADERLGELARRLVALRREGEADAVVVGVHAGDRYAVRPSDRTRQTFRALADAGADVVLGLRPALVHGVEWWHGVPLLYGIGTPFAPSDREHPEAGVAALARLRFEGRGPPAVELCPVRADGRALRPLAADSFRHSYEPALWLRLRAQAKSLGGFSLGPAAPDGCAAVGPPPAP
jgi:hypothetical protein